MNMYYFIDFEATQYSQEIIEIGCISAKGEKFTSLVKPKGERKVSKLINELTGITSEDLKEAPEAEDVFWDFLDYIEKTKDGKRLIFYCYGNCDATFCQNTLKRIDSYGAQTALSLISANLVDFAPMVSKYFLTPLSISLQKVLNFITNTEEEQNHQALDDAEKLKIIYEYLENATPLVDSPFKPQTPTVKKVKTVKVLDKITCIDSETNEEIIFSSLDAAITHALEMMPRASAAGAIKHPNRIGNKIIRAHKNRGTYINCFWKLTHRKEEVI